MLRIPIIVVSSPLHLPGWAIYRFPYQWVVGSFEWLKSCRVGTASLARKQCALFMKLWGYRRSVGGNYARVQNFIEVAYCNAALFTTHIVTIVRSSRTPSPVDVCTGLLSWHLPVPSVSILRVIVMAHCVYTACHYKRDQFCHL